MINESSHDSLHTAIVDTVVDAALDTALGNVGSDRMNVVLTALDNEMERREMDEEEVNFSDIELHDIVSDILKNIDVAEKEAEKTLDDDEDERRGFMSEMNLSFLLEGDPDDDSDDAAELRDLADDLERHPVEPGLPVYSQKMIDRIEAEHPPAEPTSDHVVLKATNGEEVILHKDMSGLETGYAVIENPGLWRDEPNHPFHNPDWKMKDGDTVIGVPKDWSGPGGTPMPVADAYQRLRWVWDQEREDWGIDFPSGTPEEIEMAEELPPGPEPGDEHPKRMGMGRRPLVGPARDVRRGRKISESVSLTSRDLRRIIKEELDLIESQWDTDSDGVVDWSELEARETSQSQPLAKLGGPHDCGAGYHYDRVNGVCVRNDYNPRTDYSDELGKLVHQLQSQQLSRM